MFLLFCFLNSYQDRVIPDIIPINGSWMAYIQNQTEWGDIKNVNESQTNPKIRPWTGPKIQPATMIGIQAKEMLMLILGILICTKPNIIRKANNTAIININFVDLKMRYGANGNKNHLNLFAFFVMF